MTLHRTTTTKPARSATRATDLEQAEPFIDDHQPEVEGFVDKAYVIGYITLVQAMGKMIDCIEARPLECKAAAKEQQAGKMNINPCGPRTSTRMHL